MARAVRYIVVLAGMTFLVLSPWQPVKSAVASTSLVAESTLFASPSTQDTDREERKLNLEIKKLEQDTGTWAQARAWLPVSGAIVALMAGSFGAYQYFDDRRRDKVIRLQEQFSSSLETVAEYVRDESRTSARLLAALIILKEVAERPELKDDYKSKVTAVVAAEATGDADFEDSQQARFDPLCLQYWPDYKSWLAEHPEEHEFLMYRYLQALRVLASRHAKDFAGMRVEGRNVLFPSYIDERDFLHFQQLVNGYRAHLALCSLEEQPARIASFGEAIGNAAVASQLLSIGESPVERSAPNAPADRT